MPLNDRSVRPATIALCLVLLLSLGIIGWVVAGPISLPFQGMSGTLQASSAIDGHDLHVRGTTNLPDGSIIDWYLYRAVLPDSIEPPAGQATVSSGAFAFNADLTDWPSGPAEAWLSFSCDWGTVQPKAATDVAGEHCEHLRGERVYVDSPGDSKQLAARVSISVP
jgi:hypothetical protein